MSEFEIGDKVRIPSDETLVEATVTVVFGDEVRLEELVRRVPGAIMVNKAAVERVSQSVGNTVDVVKSLTEDIKSGRYD